ncbi:hypothetical protein MSZK_55760 [Mycobacterium sp. shizuoka-1]|nr:hypothetical protein MSZK_55760 [Mycobacterium sp. shizuoka-1]
MTGIGRAACGLDSGSLRWRWEVRGMDPNPDYDASDEVEYFFSWLPWALRGVYPPPAYPPV